MTDNPEFDDAREDDFEIDLGLDEPVEDGADEIEIDLGLGEPEEGEDSAETVVLLDEPEDKAAEEEPEAEAEGDDATEAALTELRNELESKFGDWYVVHTYSGMENRVKQNLDNRVKALNMEDYIFETIVPTEDVVEIRNNARKTVTRTVLPGYVLVRMDLTDESWGVVRHTPSVTGFVGHAQTPIPLSLDEVEKMLTPSVLAKVAAAAAGKPARRKKVEVVDFAVGDSVQVVDGPFTGVHATITEINVNNQRLKALVEILGRETPVDLEFKQVAKAV
ncbi:MAG: transcription termination/antitermination protein NusG [Propionibacteriaceae bacterium]|nr:transcription termination/antitermination protein NusG [Propionibacteriaceae bacterium]